MNNLKYYYEIDISLLSFVQNNLRLANEPIELYGSAMNRDLKYINDYDFFSRMHKKKYDDSILKENIKNILLKFDFKKFIFMELKFQYNDGTKIKILPRQKINLEDIDFNNLEFIKLDFAYENNLILKECSLNYKFGDPKDIKRTQEININLKEQYNDKNYFKFLKRLHSLHHKNKNINNLLINFFNSETSALYTVVENLKLLEKMKLLYKNNNHIKLLIYQNIKILGYNPTVKLKSLIKNLKLIYDEKAFTLIKDHDLKRFIKS